MYFLDSGLYSCEKIRFVFCGFDNVHAITGWLLCIVFALYCIKSSKKRKYLPLTELNNHCIKRTKEFIVHR